MWNRLRTERGFTLIELVAVMAILATLVSIVAPAVTDTAQTSVQAQAQAQADSLQARNAAYQFYQREEKAEFLTPHTAELTATINDEDITATQKISSRWPESFISVEVDSSFFSEAGYPAVFPTDGSPSDDLVIAVTILNRLNEPVEDGGVGFLENHTAVDLDLLVTQGLLTDLPSGLEETATVGDGEDAVEIPQFLWLLEKKSSSSGIENDSRDVSVWVLIATEEVEGSGGKVQVTYKEVV